MADCTDYTNVNVENLQELFRRIESLRQVKFPKW